MSLNSTFRKLFTGSQEYLELPKAEESEGGGLSQIRDKPTSYHIRVLIASITANILLLLLLCAGLFGVFTRGHREKSDKRCETSAYSPVFEKFHVDQEPVLFNGSFLDEGEVPVIWRELPSPEVDEAWATIAPPQWIVINEEEAIRLGKDPSTLVKSDEAWGYGEGFVASLDLNHQIHCLNMLRMAVFPDYYPMTRSKEYNQQHWMHCIYMLLQNTLCVGTVDLITFNWRETQKFPVPDFAINKQCRKGDEILKWQDKVKIEGMKEKREALKPSSDAKILPLPPKLSKWLKNLDDLEAENNGEMSSIR